MNRRIEMGRTRICVYSLPCVLCKRPFDMIESSYRKGVIFLLMEVFLFPDFTAMDFVGPVEALQRLPETTVRYVSVKGGLVQNKQGLRIMTERAEDVPSNLLLIPGGMGTRRLAFDATLVDLLREKAKQANDVLTVCTGAVLLGKTGLLDGLRATSNKKAMDWVKATCPDVLWQDVARWVQDDKYYTASGVTAGIDMALGFIRDRYGRETAERIARGMEYVWNDDPARDPFARVS